MFSSWKKENRAVLDKVVDYTLNLPIPPMPESEDYCGVFVDGRDRGIENIYEYASFRSFKANSRANYPIFALINKNHINNFLTTKIIDDFRITIIPIEPIVCVGSSENYTNFMVKEMPFMIPEKFQKAIFWNADGYLLNKNYEEFIEHNFYHFLGAPNRHYTSVVFPDNPEIPQIRVVNQNGGFSYRRLDIQRKLSKKYGNLRNHEAGRIEATPEDLFWNYTLALEYGESYLQSALQAGNIFSQDPLRDFNHITRTYGFHSCQT